VYIEGSVSGGQYVGGLVGWSSGSMSNAYSGAVVLGSASVVGGLVGNQNSGSIANSYAIGAVGGTTDIGGLVGTNAGTLTTTYATGRVTGTLRTGGLVGTNTGTVTNSFYDGVTTAAGGVGTQVDSNTAFTQSTYTGFNFTTIWYIRAGLARPVLRGEFSTTIQTAHQLLLMDLNPVVDYTLARDIDLAEARNTSGSGIWKQGSGFAPIVGFAGDFDGKGRTINGLYINSSGTGYGLFLSTFAAEIHDLKLTNVDLNGPGFAGALASQAFQATVIRNVEVSGTNQGSVALGGLLFGATLSLIENSRSSVTVTATGSSAGGFSATANMTTIRNSSASGNVSGTQYIGGLMGVSNFSRIENSYATGSILANTFAAGGLIGEAVRSTIEGSYASGAVQFNTAATSATPSAFGGLIGNIRDVNILRSYATGDVTMIPVGANTGIATGGLVGFFGYGIIRESYATGTVRGYTSVGGLVGSNVGTGQLDELPLIDKSYATGAVFGVSQVAGLLATGNRGTISMSYAAGAVTASANSAGGLVAVTNGITRNSYATGSVTTPFGGAGLISSVNTGGIVDRTFSTGAVTSGTGGGLLGGASFATVTNSFWDTQTSGQATSAGGAGAVGRTTAQMKTLSTFTGAGWDFVDTWQIFQGVTYPHFQYQTIPGVTVVGTVYAADGVTKAGSGLNVTLVQNGTLVGTAVTNGSSIYKFIAPLSNNDALVAYLEGNVGKQGATGWRTDGTSTTTLEILGSSLSATSTTTKFADNAMFRQAAGSVVDTDLSYTSALAGGETSLSVAQGYRFYVPVGQTYRLDGNLSTAGGNVDLLGTVVVAAAAPTIRTDAVGGTLAAGSVKFATTGSIDGLVAGSQSLTINTTADGGDAAGTVRLADVGTLQRLRGLTVSSGAGLLELNDTDVDGTAKILVTTGNVDFSNVADVQFNANTLINTQPTTAGQGSVLFQTAGGGAIGDVAGRNLTIDVRGAATGVDDDGDVSLFADFGTNSIIGGSIEVLTDRGTITLGNGTFATYKMRDTGAGFAIRFVGDAVLTGTISFETNNSLADLGLSTFSSNSAGRWGLNIYSDGGFDPAAPIRFAGADNAGGNYLSGIQLFSDSFFHPTDGQVIFVDDRDDLVSILTDTDFFAFTGLAVAANNLVLEDSTLVGSMGSSPGRINLGTALIDAKFDNLSLTLTTVGATFGGQIEFGTIGRDTVAGGGRYLGSFSAAVNGTSFTGSRITLDSDITVDNTLGTGQVALSGRVEVFGSRSIVTQVGNDNAAGSVDLGGAQLYGNAAGLGLTINASAVGVAGGNVVLGTFGNDGNAASYIRTLDVDARGSTGGAIVLSGSTITLDGTGALANASRFTALGAGIVLNNSVTIRTEVGGNQNASSIDFSSTPISANAAGFDLTINTVTAAAGGTNGDITLGDLGNGVVRGFGGFYVNDLTLDAGATQSGKITTGGNVLLDALGSDVAGVTFTGRYVLALSTLIDTEAGNDAAAGAIDLRLANVSAATVNYNLTLDSSTTAVGLAGGNVQLRNVGNAGGQFVNDITIDARGGVGGTPGTFALDADLNTAGNFSFTGGAASLIGVSTILSSGGTISLLATQGATSGIVMADGSTLQTRSGNITLSANAAISLSRINSDSDNDDTRGDVALTADADNSGTGSILDILTGESANIRARNVSLLAGDRIGSITDFTAGTGDGIDITLNLTLQAARVTQANGQMFLAFQSNVAAAAGAIVVNQTDVAALILQGTGNVDLGTAGSLVTSTGDNVAITAAQVLTLPAAGINVGSGAMRLTGTTDIRDADRSLGTLAAASLAFTSGNSGGAITLATTVGSLTASVAANNLTINETDGLTALSIAAGTGSFTLSAGGSILDSDASVDITASSAVITLNGAFGSNTNAINTTVGGLSVDSTDGGQWINQSAGLTALDLKAGTGAITLTTGGSITDTDALADFTAASATVTLSGAFGSSTNAINTMVGGLSVDSGNASQWISEADGLTALDLKAGTGTITLAAGGAITDADVLADLVASSAVVTLSGAFGSSTNAINTTVGALSIDSTNGSQWINQSAGLTALDLTAGAGAITLTAGGSITDTDTLADFVAAAATITLTSGTFGSSTNSINTTVATLTIDSTNGSQWINQSSGLTALELKAGTGAITISTGGAIGDADSSADLVAASVVVTVGGDFGSSVNAINTTVTGLTVDSGNASQWIDQSAGLTALDLKAGTGTITLAAGGSITDADALAELIADSAKVSLNGAFGSSFNAIHTTVKTLSVDSTNGNQWIDQSAGLTALELKAGTGAIALISGGAISDADALTDLVAATATVTLSGAFGSSINAIDTTVGGLSVDSGNFNQWINQSSGLTALELKAGTGDVVFSSFGSVLDADALVDIVANSAVITLTSGHLGSSTNAIGTTVADLTVDTGNGNQFLAETAGLTALDLKAGTGAITLTIGGSITDTDALADFTAASATVTLSGAFGSSTNAINTMVGGLSVDSGNASQWISEADGLTALNLKAGTGAIALAAGGSITDTDLPADLVAASAVITLDGDFGSGTNSINTTVADLTIDSTNGSQWISQSAGLTALALKAGTGDVVLSAGGSIADADALDDILASTAVISTGGALGSSTDALGTVIGRLTTESVGGQWFVNTGSLIADMQASGLGSGITLNVLGGSLDLVRMSALGTLDLTAASGAIRDAGTETGANITASRIRLAAADGIGSSGDGDLDLSAANVEAVNTNSGDIVLRSFGTSPVSFDLVDAQNTAGLIDLTAFAATTLVDLRTAGGSISAVVTGASDLTAVVTGASDLTAVDVTAAGTGAIALQSGRDLAVHGGVVAAGGNVALNAGRDLTVDTSLASRNVSVHTLVGDVALDVGRNFTLAGSVGRTAAVGSQAGDTSVAAGGNVAVNGSSGGTARVGGLSAAAGDITLSSGGGTTISASAAGSLALIGHVAGSGHVAVVADRDLTLSSSGGATAQIGHLNSTAGDSVDVAWSQFVPLGFGFGKLTLSRTSDSTTAIAAGAGARVQLFGGLRDGFVTIDRGVTINSHPFSGNQSLYPSIPTASGPGSAWDQTISYFNSPIEVWGPTTFGSATTETSPFTFYFNSVIPGLVAEGRQSFFFGLLNGLGFEYERARYLLDGLSRSRDVQVTADIDPITFEQRRRTAMGKEITGGSSL
jgi:hypothetical protein